MSDMKYEQTSKDIADYFGVSVKAVIQWARIGYPVMVDGDMARMRLIGAQQVGRQWRFNIKAIINFIENTGNEQWVRSNGHTKTKTARQSLPKIGRLNTSSAASASATRLMDHLASRKRKQTEFVTI